MGDGTKQVGLVGIRTRVREVAGQGAKGGVGNGQKGKKQAKEIPTEKEKLCLFRQVKAEGTENKKTGIGDQKKCLFALGGGKGEKKRVVIR